VLTRVGSLSSPNLLDGIVIIKNLQDTDYDGIVSKFSNSLKFIDNGADFINPFLVV
jgi:hypothetical protein